MVPNVAAFHRLGLSILGSLMCYTYVYICYGHYRWACSMQKWPHDTHIWSRFCVFGCVPFSVMSRAIFYLQVYSTGYCFSRDPSHLAYMLSLLIVFRRAILTRSCKKAIVYTSLISEEIISGKHGWNTRCGLPVDHGFIPQWFGSLFGSAYLYIYRW